MTKKLQLITLPLLLRIKIVYHEHEWKVAQSVSLPALGIKVLKVLGLNPSAAH